MSRSASLRAPDFRAIYQIVGECRELGDDPVLWRRHLIAGMSSLIGGEFCVSGEIGNGTRPSRYTLGTIDTGAGNGFNRAYWLKALSEFQADAFFNPHMNAIFNRAAWGVAQPRAAFLPDREWYSSFCFREVVRTLGADVSLLCLQPISGARDDHSALYLMRHIGARDFNGRECAGAAEVMAQVAPLIGGPLARFGEPSPAALPPRAREVLRCLLEGDSDKQVGARLALTRHTVNQYVKAIYAHFGVGSRAELLARWVRRGWGGRCAWAD
jgi:DNA-binding CsgD family transcriptional regulator